MGAGHPCQTLSLSALRAMLAQVDVHAIQVDAEALARPVSTLAAVW